MFGEIGLSASFATQLLNPKLLEILLTCACGEITIWGGNQALLSCAKHYDNFLRVDEEGNIYPVKYCQSREEENPKDDNKENLPSINSIEEMLDTPE